MSASSLASRPEAVRGTKVAASPRQSAQVGETPYWPQFLEHIGVSKGVDCRGGKGFNTWPLPATTSGSYSGGNMAGQALARLFIEWLRTSKGDTKGGCLQSIVLDILEVERSSKQRKDTALRGQIVGFFFEIERWLSGIARMTTPLDPKGLEELAVQMRRGLAHTKSDEQAEIHATQRAQRSVAARRAWQRKRKMT